MSAAGGDSRAVLARLDPRVPAALAQRAESYRPPPVEPRLSASVLLMRDGVAGLEVYVLHRQLTMAFAAGVVAFPGGGAEPGETPIEVARRETAEETGVRLDPTALLPWAHWITPACEARRYDTHFFVAALPAGQTAEDLTTETVRAEWAAPRAVLNEADTGRLVLMPPTRSMLLELADCVDLAAVLVMADGRQVHPVLPDLVRTEAGWSFVWPKADR
ncbi:NUDIX hydrolase [Propionibacteriaceae bacterium Y1700]|uniref:NUDIX hydrolase n=1 Tax=Microlunatus sp. Y1700 TaxID=3418487 RepID=UPI003DA71B5E